MRVGSTEREGNQSTVEREMSEMEEIVPRVARNVDPVDQSPLDMMLEIEELLAAPPAKLRSWCQTHLPEGRFRQFESSFTEHCIDGLCFGLLTEAHLMELAPEASVGDRLYMLSLRDKVNRAVRMVKRNNVVMELDVICDPPHSKAHLILTEGAVKLIFSSKQKVKLESVADGRATKDKASAERTTKDKASKKIKEELRAPKSPKPHVVTYTDFIDLACIDDVDILTETEIVTTYRTEREQQVHRTCCGERVKVAEVRHKTGVSEEGIAKLFISLNTPTSLGRGASGGIETKHVTLTISKFREGQRLRDLLVRVMEEQRGVQITQLE